MTTNHHSARPRVRTLLLASVALGAMLSVGATSASFAAGGSGGAAAFSGSNAGGGSGGTVANPDGGAGGASGDAAGGGGGGAGGGGQGGAGGVATNSTGGTGGTGGAHGDVEANTVQNTTNRTGQNGGPGATGSGNASGGGGGGGGGFGLLIRGQGGSSNNATVTGGNGGIGAGGITFAASAAAGGGGGDGGIGVSSSANSGASFINSVGGAIRGGDGGQGGRGGGFGGNGASGLGGAGVSFAGSNGALINSSNATDIYINAQGLPVSFTGITGGTGGVGALGSGGANGGNGVEFLGANGAFNNTTIDAVTGGVVAGGLGGANNANGGIGGDGGIGAFFANGGMVTNQANASITGGQGGNAGFVDTNGQGQTNITSGTGGTGGAGIFGSNLTIMNSAQISGGRGGSGDFFSFFDDGKAGSGNGGNGGVGISGANLTIANAATGTISGGAGGNGGLNMPGTFSGGNGGIGILADNTTITNAGTIRGGNGGGGTNGGTNGNGGIGIVGSNLTIDNTGGTIAGGFAGTPADVFEARAVPAAPPPGGPQAYAIQFTGGTNTVGTGGTINGGIYVGTGASFQPALNGTNPGTPLTVNGPINFAPGSVYNVRVTPAASDRAIANTSSAGAPGISTVTGASVNAAFGNGTYQVRQYTILTAAAGVAGTFSGLTFSQNFAFLTPTLSYDPNNVYLNIAPTNPLPAQVINPATGQPVQVPDYRPAAITYNQIAVASGLTQAGIQNGGRGPVLKALNQLSAAQARNAFDNLSGEGITAAQNIAFRSTQLFTSSIFDQTTFYSGAANSVTLCDDHLYRRILTNRPDQNSCEPVHELADLPARSFQPAPAAAPNRTWRAWATGWGGTEHIAGNAFPIGSATQNNSLYGGSLGVDYQLLPNYLVGVALGGSNGDFQVDQRGTYGTTTGGHVAIYDLLSLGNWYGASSSSFSYFGNRTTRYVTGFGGLGSETERGDFDSHEYRTRLEIGRHFGGLPTLASFGGVTPFVALELAELRSNGFTEYTQRGAGNFRLNISGQSLASAPGFVGLRFQRATAIGNGITLSPTLQVAYVHEFAPYRSQIGTIADLPGSTFLVDGARPARNAAQVKAGAEMAIGARSVIFANFDGEFSGVNQLYAGKGGFRYAW